MKKLTLSAFSTLLLASCSTAPLSQEAYKALSAGALNGYEEVSQYELGKGSLQAHNYGLAITAFMKELERNPESIGALNGLAIAYNEIGRGDVANDYWERALALDPNSEVTLNNLSYFNLKRGDREMALAYATKARAQVAGTSDTDPSIVLVIANNIAAASGEALERLNAPNAIDLPSDEGRGTTRGSVEKTGVREWHLNTAANINAAAPVDPVQIPVPSLSTLDKNEISAPPGSEHDGRPQSSASAVKVEAAEGPGMEFQKQATGDAINLAQTDEPSRDEDVEEADTLLMLRGPLPETSPTDSNPLAIEEGDNFETTSVRTATASIVGNPVSANEPLTLADLVSDPYVVVQGYSKPSAPEDVSTVVHANSGRSLSRPALGRTIANDVMSQTISATGASVDEIENAHSRQDVFTAPAETATLVSLLNNPTVFVQQLPTSDGTRSRDSAIVSYQHSAAAAGKTLQELIDDPTIMVQRLPRILAEPPPAAVSGVGRIRSVNSATEVRTAPSAQIHESPLKSSHGSPSSQENSIAWNNIELRISNGAGRKNMAHRFARAISERGIYPDYVANARSFDYRNSYVFYNPGLQLAAREIAALMPVSPTLIEAKRGTGSVEVILGSDFLAFDDTL